MFSKRLFTMISLTRAFFAFCKVLEQILFLSQKNTERRDKNETLIISEKTEYSFLKLFSLSFFNNFQLYKAGILVQAINYSNFNYLFEKSNLIFEF